MTPDRMSSSGLARFWAKATRTDGCWIWTGARNPKGYGRFSLRGKTRRAHRVAWLATHGHWPPDSLMVCHSCDNPSCVRPDHLYLGTAATNQRDAAERGRRRDVARNGPNNLSRAKVLDLLARAGESTSALADEAGVSRRAVQDALSGRTWGAGNYRPFRLRGEKSPTSKLTRDEAMHILQSKERAADLARRFGVSPRLVRAIRSGERWPHLSRGGED